MNRMNLLLITIAILVLASCAKNSGIVPVGTNKYMVSRQAATGSSGMTTLEADAMAEAYEECQKTGRTVEVIEKDQSEPPYIFGNFTRVAITFKCVVEEEHLG